MAFTMCSGVDLVTYMWYYPENYHKWILISKQNKSGRIHNMEWWTWLLIVVLVVLIVGYFWYRSKK